MESKFSEVRAADIVRPGFFESAADPQPGVHGFYSAALAGVLRRDGVDAGEFAAFVDAFAKNAAAAFDDDPLPPEVKTGLERASREWQSRCPKLAEVLYLSGEMVQSADALAGLVIYLDRVREQLALMASFPRPEGKRGGTQ
jgi:hypothetical protein